MADSSGLIVDAGRPGGLGFRLVPAVAYDSAAALRPGSFPVTVKFRGGALPPLTIYNSDVKYLAEKHEGFTIEGAESGDAWVVEEYRHRNEGTIPSGAKGRRTVAVQGTATAVPTGNPSGTDGYKVRPGTLGHNFYFSGLTSTRTADVWVRSRTGNWYDTAPDGTIDPSTGVVEYRGVAITADRIYLKASGAGLNVEIDADIEVG